MFIPVDFMLLQKLWHDEKKIKWSPINLIHELYGKLNKKTNFPIFQ